MKRESAGSPSGGPSTQRKNKGKHSPWLLTYDVSCVLTAKPNNVKTSINHDNGRSDILTFVNPNLISLRSRNGFWYFSPTRLQSRSCQLIDIQKSQKHKRRPAGPREVGLRAERWATSSFSLISGCFLSYSLVRYRAQLLLISSLETTSWLFIWKNKGHYINWINGKDSVQCEIHVVISASVFKLYTRSM